MSIQHFHSLEGTAAPDRGLGLASSGEAACKQEPGLHGGCHRANTRALLTEFHLSSPAGLLKLSLSSSFWDSFGHFLTLPSWLPNVQTFCRFGCLLLQPFSCVLFSCFVFLKILIINHVLPTCQSFSNLPSFCSADVCLAGSKPEAQVPHRVARRSE